MNPHLIVNAVALCCLSQDSVHASLEQLQELELQMHTVTASESLRDTLRAERTFAFQVLHSAYTHGSRTTVHDLDKCIATHLPMVPMVPRSCSPLCKGIRC